MARGETAEERMRVNFFVREQTRAEMTTVVGMVAQVSVALTPTHIWVKSPSRSDFVPLIELTHIYDVYLTGNLDDILLLCSFIRSFRSNQYLHIFKDHEDTNQSKEDDQASPEKEIQMKERHKESTKEDSERQDEDASKEPMNSPTSPEQKQAGEDRLKGHKRSSSTVILAAANTLRWGNLLKMAPFPSFSSSLHSPSVLALPLPQFHFIIEVKRKEFTTERMKFELATTCKKDAEKWVIAIQEALINAKQSRMV